MGSELRDYQERAITALREEIRAGKKRIILQLATGAGKTVIASSIINMGREKQSRIAFTCPAISLIDQTVNAFAREGILDVGVIQARHPLTNPHAPVQVCSVQTLVMREFPDIDFVIVDEAHRHFEVIEKWMAERPDTIFIGLSATPWRKGLGKVWDSLIPASRFGATTAELIDKGFLCEFEIYGPQEDVDLSGIKTVAGDYHEGQLSERMRDKKLTGDIIGHWKRIADGKRTFLFAVDRAHADFLKEEFLGAGIKAGYMDANTPLGEREELLEELRSRRLDLIVNIGVLTTGVDAPWLECIVLARPTKSEMLYVQIVGRALRTSEGKEKALIIDHTKTTERLGYVTHIMHETLDMGEPKRAKSDPLAEEALPKKCPECQFIKPPKMAVCPMCGHEAKRFKAADLDPEEADLVRLGPRGAKTAPVAWEMTQFLREVMYIADERGKDERWVLAQYRAKYGRWPEQKVEDEFPMIPRQSTRNWIKSRQIAYAKGKAKQQDEGRPF